jgi:hypothetical protein
MGKSSKTKQRVTEAKEAEFQNRFAQARQAPRTVASRPLIDEFGGYLEQAVRSPETFTSRTRSSDRGKQAIEMARHLFGRFRVPRVLEQAWGAYILDEPHASGILNRRPAGVPQAPAAGRVPRVAGHAAAPGSNLNLAHVDFRAWFVAVATGRSLYKEHTKGFLTKKETASFLGAPSVLDICQAIVYAVARGAGALDGPAQRLARSKLAAQAFHDPFWFDAIRFFCLPDHMPVSITQANDLVDFVVSRHQEDRHFRLLGSSQSLAAILRRMEQWHRALARAQDLSGIQWDGVDLPDYTVEHKDPDHKNRTIEWTFHQITTGKELAAEGTAQRHCVFGYKASCVSGRCSIWSLTRTDMVGTKVRHLTIELTSHGRIVQKRGLANRPPRSDEERAVADWAAKFNLDNPRTY